MAARLITADSSVVVAALSGWHVSHAVSLEALDDVERLPVHVLMESYSVLTRLPRGLAISAVEAAERLKAEFPGGALGLSVDDHVDLLGLLGRSRVIGGAVYDAVVGYSAQRAGALLLTGDRRALRTYEALGVDVELVG
ncbi:MAG TPA: PIN domain-containing protein [Actinomycetales bacterium]|nr:PIN domain-containing protein [Actinomycetales bacterium]